MIIYKASQEIPAQLSDFYDSLFKLLLQRHDGTKPGYRRKRLCEINDIEYRRVFEAFCYLAKKHSQTALDHETIYATAEQALKAVNISEDAEKFLTDILKITCLIVRDGDEYRFIHKSVQEYYAACFIKNKPEIIAKKMYELMFFAPAKSQWAYQWNHELSFLSEIDAYRFMKYGVVPAICRYLEISEQELPSATSEQVQPAVLMHFRTGVMCLMPDNNFPRWILMPWVDTLFYENLGPLYEIDYSPVFEAVKAGQLTSKVVRDSGFEVQCKALLDSELMASELADATLKISTNLLQAARGCLGRIAADEQDQIALTPLLE